MSARSPLLKLHPQDNVWVTIRDIDAGEIIDGMTMINSVSLGHKIASTPLRPGEKIYKWGVPIGSVISSVSQGDHLHLHNMKSDYLPTYTLDEERSFVVKRSDIKRNS